MKEIALSGKHSDVVTLVDDEDFDEVSRRKWHLSPRGRTFYARGRWREGEVLFQVYLHVMLTGWQMVDHVNGDGLDNRRENLRAVTSLENNRNSRKPESYNGRPCTSPYKGVSRRSDSRLRPWRVAIKVNYRQLNVGRFATEIEAAIAYDIAARQYHGEYARLNFPEGNHNERG